MDLFLGRFTYLLMNLLYFYEMSEFALLILSALSILTVQMTYYNASDKAVKNWPAFY